NKIPPSARKHSLRSPLLSPFPRKTKTEEPKPGGGGGHTHIVDRRQHEWHSKTCATPVCAPPSHPPNPILPADQQSKSSKILVLQNSPSRRANQRMNATQRQNMQRPFRLDGPSRRRPQPTTPGRKAPPPDNGRT
ncbi:unnamed protein product, partial [Ectocarpus sp. 8 AP-2014]